MNAREEATRAAERAVVGAMLLHRPAIKEANALLNADTFHDPRNGYVFTAVVTLDGRGVRPDLPAVLDELRRAGNLHGALDGAYLATLQNEACITGEISYHAEIVTREYRRRCAQLTLRSAMHALDETEGDDLPQLAAKLSRDLSGLAESLPARTSPRRLLLTPASEIRIRPVRWLWDTTPAGEPPTSQGRIPLYTLAIAAGGPGLGKSQFAAWVTAHVTRGTLPGELFGSPRSVIYAATEDDWERTIAPRLVAAGADLERVFRIDVQDDADLHARLTLPVDISLLGETAEAYSVALVVADPLLSMIDASINDYRAAEVRAALEPLVAAAAQHDFSVLGLAHFTKAGAADPLARIAGTGAFGQLIRSLVTFAKQTNEDGSREFVLSTSKNNLGRDDLSSFSYTIQPVTIPTDEGPSHVSKFVLGPQTSLSVLEVMRAEGQPNDRAATTEAMEWLQAFLAECGGSEKIAEIKKFAHKEGISDSALYRARDRLGIRSRVAGFGKDKGATWFLPEAWTESSDA